ncbi:MAG TPA: metallopeptidase family protein [Acidimicrobiales bacterium]|nr:metallopeptidase family protein [Acidimicrobiales bacterium]
MIDLDPARFEELVADALDSIPEALARRMDNVAVVVEDGHPDGELLGRYEGVPLTERDAWYGTGGLTLPDRITIFRRPICAVCATEDEVVEQVRITVVHEVAHHFGIDDERLHELGWA